MRKVKILPRVDGKSQETFTVIDMFWLRGGGVTRVYYVIRKIRNPDPLTGGFVIQRHTMRPKKQFLTKIPCIGLLDYRLLDWILLDWTTTGLDYYCWSGLLLLDWTTTTGLLPDWSTTGLGTARRARQDTTVLLGWSTTAGLDYWLRTPDYFNTPPKKTNFLGSKNRVIRRHTKSGFFADPPP